MSTYSIVAVAAVILATAPVQAQEASARAEQNAQASQTATAQGVPAADQARDRARNRNLASIVPLKVTIVLSRYQGEKKISSEPYELSVRTDGNKASIRMATQVPLPAPNQPQPPSPPTPPGGGSAQPAPRVNPLVNMRDVGTNIDCSATNLDNGRYAVTVTIEDSSISEDNQRSADGSKTERTKSIRTFRTTNALVLRDGQTTEFTAATDKVTGEAIKAAVTLTVIK